MNDKQLQLVNFEQAKRLKAAGFDWVCDYYYPANGGEIDIFTNIVNDEGDGRYFTAPTVALALKWFRDVKGIFSCVDFAIPNFHKGFYWNYFSFENRDICNKTQHLFNTYESAERALLDELLTILEKGE